MYVLILSFGFRDSKTYLLRKPPLEPQHFGTHISVFFILNYLLLPPRLQEDQTPSAYNLLQRKKKNLGRGSIFRLMLFISKTMSAVKPPLPGGNAELPWIEPLTLLSLHGWMRLA